MFEKRGTTGSFTCCLRFDIVWHDVVLLLFGLEEKGERPWDGID